MNYLPYILAAYCVAFGLITVMFVTSYRKYRRVKNKYSSPNEAKSAEETN
jgi:hypothetical protein